MQRRPVGTGAVGKIAGGGQDPHRQSTFRAHRHTQTVPLLYDADFRHANPTAQPKFAPFEAELRPLFDYMAAVYGAAGNVIPVSAPRLDGGLGIPLHRDVGFSLECSYRVHVPIVNEQHGLLQGRR